MKATWRTIGRVVALCALSAIALQVYFLGRVALMRIVDPTSTSFQRSEAWRLLTTQTTPGWSRQWVARNQISPNLQRAVIASEDAGFVDHGGIEWDAVERAWGRNQQAEARVEKLNERLERQGQKPAPNRATSARSKAPVQPKVVGGSTITQQLAKNLFLDGERSLLRKAQEFAITVMLEALLDKPRLLEIYLNNVEWGEGVFGAEAAARHYFHIGAAQLGPTQAAQLAVMLPAPKRLEKQSGSAYVVGRAGTVRARMGAVELP
jgi:monofunctional glycosyltransferase